MRMRNFVLFGIAFASMAVYAEPINLGCSARGALAALTSSVAFREAIGDANAANYLGSVYDASGQQLSPQSAKALHCPLFIDSDAQPSASASKAILSAEAAARTAKPELQAAAPVAHGALVVSSVEGIVAVVPQPEVAVSKAQDQPQVAPKRETASARTRHVVKATSVTGPVKQQTRSEVAQVRPEPAPPVAAAQSPKQVEVTNRQSTPATQREESLVLSFGRALGMIRQVETGGRAPVLEIDPLMMLLYFLALFVLVGAVALLAFNPRPLMTPAQRRFELLEAESLGFAASDRYKNRQADMAGLKRQKPVQSAPSRVSPSLVAGD